MVHSVKTNINVNGLNLIKKFFRYFLYCIFETDEYYLSNKATHPEGNGTF